MIVPAPLNGSPNLILLVLGDGQMMVAYDHALRAEETEFSHLEKRMV